MIAPRVKVRDLAEQVRGVSYEKQDVVDGPSPGYLPVLRAGNITDNGLTYDDLVFVPAERVSDKQKIRRHDVVVATSSGSLSVSGARPRQHWTIMRVVQILSVRSCVRTQKVHPSYFAHFFKTTSYRQRISVLAAGASINNLRNEHLDDMEIPLPSLADQGRIADFLDRAEGLRTKRRAALAQIDSLAKATFFDLFGGTDANRKGWPIHAMQDIVKEGTIVTYGIVQAGAGISRRRSPIYEPETSLTGRSREAIFATRTRRSLRNSTDPGLSPATSL